MSDEIALRSFIAKGFLKTSLESASAAIASLPGASKLSYGSVVTYSIKGSNSNYDILEIYSDHLRFAFSTNTFDTYSKAAGMSRFLAIVNFLSNHYSISIDSLYTDLQDILLHFFSIPELPDEEDESLKIKVHQLSMANLSLSATVSRLQMQKKNVERERDLQRQALLEIATSFMLASGKNVEVFAKKLHDLDISKSSIEILLTIIKSDKNEKI